MNRSSFKRKFFKTAFIFALFILSACTTSNVATSTATLSAPTITKTLTPTPTVTPSPTPTVVFESFGLTPELAKALKRHAGLELSIVNEVDGKYTTTVTILNSNGKSNAQEMGVDPSTLSENLSSKNHFGDTPTMMTTEGKKLYWIQEQLGWYLIEISNDIHNPTITPFGKQEIATRAIIVEFPDDFSQEALDWWKNTPGLEIGFQLLNVNYNTGENTKFAYLRNQAVGLPDRTIVNSPVQILDAWFAIDYPDGTRYVFFPTKWLDPSNPRKPRGDEWKIIFATSGPEIMNNEFNRSQFDKLLTQASTPSTHMEITPIVKVQDGFFDGTNNLITFSVAQPSLQQLSKQVDNDFGALLIPNNTSLPNVAERYYRFWLDGIFLKLSQASPSLSFRFQDKNDPAWKTYFFPDEVQTILFPALITLR